MKWLLSANASVFKRIETAGAQERTRTSTALRPPAPEAGASTIPPPGHGALNISSVEAGG